MPSVFYINFIKWIYYWVGTEKKAFNRCYLLEYDWEESYTGGLKVVDELRWVFTCLGVFLYSFPSMKWKSHIFIMLFVTSYHCTWCGYYCKYIVQLVTHLLKCAWYHLSIAFPEGWLTCHNVHIVDNCLL